jgi:2'-5' RNA ligase
MRAFLAIGLPDDVRQALGSLQQQLADARADVKWVAEEHLHLTLKFLDDITEEKRQAVEAALTHVAAGEAPFTSRLGTVGAFPSPRAPRVLWVSLAEGDVAAARIAAALEAETRRLGLRAEERPFSAHITLGRVRSPHRREALASRLGGLSWEPPAPWQVTALSLYQSVLGPVGPQYTVLAEAPLCAR